MFLGELIRDIRRAIGEDSIMGIPPNIIAENMNITISMVKEAQREGCDTYEEIREFFDI